MNPTSRETSGQTIISTEVSEPLYSVLTVGHLLDSKNPHIRLSPGSSSPIGCSDARRELLNNALPPDACCKTPTPPKQPSLYQRGSPLMPRIRVGTHGAGPIIRMDTYDALSEAVSPGGDNHVR
jgi:hypothetical protein